MCANNSRRFDKEETFFVAGNGAAKACAYPIQAHRSRIIACFMRFFFCVFENYLHFLCKFYVFFSLFCFFFFNNGLKTEICVWMIKWNVDLNCFKVLSYYGTRVINQSISENISTEFYGSNLCSYHKLLIFYLNFTA